MRPEILFPLFAEVTTLKGVGARLGGLITRVAGGKVLDLCFHLPVAVIDRRPTEHLASVPDGGIATLVVTVEEHRSGSGPNRPWRVACRHDGELLTLVFFHARADWLLQALPAGARRLVSGTVERFRGEVQISHPDYILPPDAAAQLPKNEPVYPLTAGLAPKTLRRAIEQAVAAAPALPEWLDPGLKTQRRWPDWQVALHAVHAPSGSGAIDPADLSRQRLAYDELLADQLAISLIRARQRRAAGRVVPPESELRARVTASLPFPLTGAQTRALTEIGADMASGTRMLRMLQGDVGSGKTVVALLAMLDVVACGGQAALMAPTEILARQHFATIERFAAAAGVRVALLAGRERKAARETTLASIAAGEIQIVVGTHAVFQQTVDFADLALAVVDEQHRFGVDQRMALTAKGRNPHLLVMTATPIPRTLLLTAYGDLDASRLDEKPPGRQPVDTRVVSAERMEQVLDGIDRALGRGDKVYWVCPLVEDSEVSDLAAAESRHRELAARFGTRVGLVHGRMKGTEKDAMIERFAQGDIDLLVATTVIEVGVDVPRARVIVIEHAERFGLAQLHQLRGRVGRGEGRSACILLYHPPIGEIARERLATIRATDDGFRIAEEDLRLRGAGEVLGTRQSGLPKFRLADLATNADLLAVARDDARLVLDRDADLASPRGQALRVLLYLFERDAAVRYLRSG